MKSENALIVLPMATQFVTDFLSVDEPTKKPSSVVALIGGSECARRTKERAGVFRDHRSQV